MMSSLIPSEKYSCSGSPLILMKGSTTIAGRSGKGGAEGGRSRTGRMPFDGSLTAPTKRRQMVRINFCSLPLSPRAIRAALMRLVNVESETVPAAPDQGDQVLLADDVIAVL